jgi:hypothetical protein
VQNPRAIQLDGAQAQDKQLHRRVRLLRSAASRPYLLLAEIA